jgi:hypothetical protein
MSRPGGGHNEGKPVSARCCSEARALASREVRAVNGVERKNASKKGWCIYHHLPSSETDRMVAFGLSEVEARTEVRRRNARLNAQQGQPESCRGGFEFYYCHHGNYTSSPRDHGLDQWIDELAKTESEQ